MKDNERLRKIMKDLVSGALTATLPVSIFMILMSLMGSSLINNNLAETRLNSYVKCEYGICRIQRPENEKEIEEWAHKGCQELSKCLGGKNHTFISNNRATITKYDCQVYGPAKNEYPIFMAYGATAINKFAVVCELGVKNLQK